MTKSIHLAIGLIGALATLSASAITIDGNLSDWNIDPATWKSSDPTVHSTIEDQVGNGSFYLSPGWGGQAYDAEAIYTKISQTDQKLYIALATGHNPRTLNNPAANTFGAGDFAIDFGRNGTFDLGINIKHVVGVDSGGGYTFESFGVEGGVYSNPTWAYGLWNASGAYTNPNDPSYAPDLLNPTHMLAGIYRGMAELAYTVTPTTGYGGNQNDPHYFYELSIDLGLLTRSGWDGGAFDVHWTENCANDGISVDPPANVPEPASYALFGLALSGLLAVRRKSVAVANCR
ncbi:MAG TPA: PEP-CTERM sorting domain-containing protein [Accumulibacter sp.]|jgi:hypothetical protein|nr:PEP-CTERM sorting domain-containing protein [Accumulibacter sp.]HQC80058.1 PEP-CTERM sorting domain-containing protein [Accumulibacter sp.]